MTKNSGALIRIPVDQIEVVSQVRKTFTKETITELAASIDSNGLLQPITVRADHGSTQLRYVLVFGERRLKAVRQLGWPKIDAILRVFETDELAQIERKQIVENVQRDDLDPMDEAEVYAGMIGPQLTIEDVAAKMGRTVAYCYRRLRLNDLDPRLKKLLRAGDLTIGAAEELARQEKSVQKRFVSQHHHQGMDVAGVRRFLHMFVRNDLANAPFDKEDKSLVKGALPCLSCPKRTGYAPNLFDDDQAISGLDMCQDPVCYGAKCVAHLKARIRQEKPQLLIALDHHLPHWLSAMKLKWLGAWEWTPKKEKDGGQKAIVVCATNTKHIGAVRWVRKGRQQETHELSPAQLFNNRIDKWEQRVTSEITNRESAIVAFKIKSRKGGRREAEFLVWSMWDESHYETRKTVLKMLGLALPTTQQHGTTFHDEHKPLRKHIAAVKTIPELFALAVVIATAPCVGAGRYEMYGAQDRQKKYKEILQSLKIDQKALRAAVVKDLPRPTKPKTTTTKRKATT